MVKHPNVIASINLGGCVLLSAVLICVFLSSLDSTLAAKGTGGMTVSFPSVLQLSSPSGESVHVSLKNAEQTPLHVGP
jgi:hypothetical protein